VERAPAPMSEGMAPGVAVPGADEGYPADAAAPGTPASGAAAGALPALQDALPPVGPAGAAESVPQARGEPPQDSPSGTPEEAGGASSDGSQDGASRARPPVPDDPGLCRGTGEGRGAFGKPEASWDADARVFTALLPLVSEEGPGAVKVGNSLGRRRGSVTYLDFAGNFGFAGTDLTPKGGPFRLLRFGRHPGFVRLGFNYREGQSPPAAPRTDIRCLQNAVEVKFSFGPAAEPAETPSAAPEASVESPPAAPVAPEELLPEISAATEGITPETPGETPAAAPAVPVEVPLEALTAPAASGATPPSAPAAPEAIPPAAPEHVPPAAPEHVPPAAPEPVPPAAPDPVPPAAPESVPPAAPVGPEAIPPGSPVAPEEITPAVPDVADGAPRETPPPSVGPPDNLQPAGTGGPSADEAPGRNPETLSPCSGEGEGRGVFGSPSVEFNPPDLVVVTIPLDSRDGPGRIATGHNLRRASGNVSLLDFAGRYGFGRGFVAVNRGPVGVLRFGTHPGFTRLSVNWLDGRAPESAEAELFCREGEIRAIFRITGARALSAFPEDGTPGAPSPSESAPGPDAALTPNVAPEIEETPSDSIFPETDSHDFPWVPTPPAPSPRTESPVGDSPNDASAPMPLLPGERAPGSQADGGPMPALEPPDSVAADEPADKAPIIVPGPQGTLVLEGGEGPSEIPAVPESQPVIPDAPELPPRPVRPDLSEEPSANAVPGGISPAEPPRPAPHAQLPLGHIPLTPPSPPALRPPETGTPESADGLPAAVPPAGPQEAPPEPAEAGEAPSPVVETATPAEAGSEPAAAEPSGTEPLDPAYAACSGQGSGSGTFGAFKGSVDAEGRFVLELPFRGTLGAAKAASSVGRATGNVTFIDFAGTYRARVEDERLTGGPVGRVRFGYHEGSTRLSLNWRDSAAPRRVTAELLCRGGGLVVRLTPEVAGGAR
jgi:hypothetical protein